MIDLVAQYSELIIDLNSALENVLVVQNCYTTWRSASPSNFAYPPAIIISKLLVHVFRAKHDSLVII